jgi:hypothetical protein
MEIIEELAATAGEKLRRLGYDNVEVRVDNGQLGWPQHAPYDAILVLNKNSRDRIEGKNVLPVAFVPLTGALTP